MENVISDSEESSDEEVVVQPKLEKPKRVYNRKPLTEEQKEALRERLAKARQNKKDKKEPKQEPKQETKKEPKPETKQEEQKPLLAPSIINNYYYGSSPPKKEATKRTRAKSTPATDKPAKPPAVAVMTQPPMPRFV